MFAFLVILILIRPFISSLAFPCLNITYSSILLIFLLVWIIFRGLPLKEIKPIRLPLVFFVLALAISIVFSSDKLNSLYEIYKYLTAILLFLIIVPLSEKNKTIIIQAIILSAVLIGILAIYQYLFGFKHLLNFITEQRISSAFVLDYLNRQRVFFPFVTPNTLAGYLIIVIPLVFLIKGKQKWIIFLTLSIALFLTKSLGAFLSLFLGALFYLLLRKNFSIKRFALLALAALACVSVFVLRQTATSEHILPIFSVVRRLDYWRDTLVIIKRHPFVGVGIGNFNLPLTNYAHNSYLQIWAETGILGLASLLWLIGAIFKFGFQYINNSLYKNRIIVLLAANTVFLIHNFIDFTFFLPEVALVWWVTLGVILFKKEDTP